MWGKGVLLACSPQELCYRMVDTWLVDMLTLFPHPSLRVPILTDAICRLTMAKAQANIPSTEGLEHPNCSVIVHP